MHPSRYESLDVWRGVACLLVVLFHSAVYVANGEFDARVRTAGGSVSDWLIVVVGRFWVGVPLFFVVSGYCIAASADATRAGGRVGRYFVRRLRRIYPPLWAAVALSTVAALSLPPAVRPGPTSEGMPVHATPAEMSAWQWVGSLTLTESWRPSVVGPERRYAMGHLWTLCYEEQFYVLVGLILLAATTRSA